MAQCLLRTRRMVFPKTSPTLQFVRYRHGPGGQILMNPRASRPERSWKVAAKASQDLMGDIGLLSDTFIMPTRANLPSILNQPGVRYQLFKARIWQRMIDIRDMVIFRWATKNKLRLREPKKVAPLLHRDMYTAFAEGDLETLRLICGEGLLDSFRKRIAARGTTRMEWKLQSMVRRPRVVSSKAHHYMGLGLNRRQVIVRIHSIQSLTKFTPQGSIVEGSNTPKEVVEYVVIEKKYENGKESPWYVWGTTEETTLERLKEQRKKKIEMLKYS